MFAMADIAAGIPDIVWDLCWVALVAMLVLAILLTIVHFRWKIFLARTQFDDLKHENEELLNFLNSVVYKMSGDNGIDGALKQVANNIKGKIGAESLCVLQRHDRKFSCVCVSGPCWLAETDDENIIGNESLLTEFMSEQEFPIGRGSLGSFWNCACKERINDASVDPRFVSHINRSHLESMMVVPHLSKDEKVDILIVALNNTAQKWEPFPAIFLDRLEQLSREIVMVMQLTDVYNDIMSKDRIDQELGFARSLQEAILPSKVVRVDGMEIVADSNSAKEVNGDFFDIIEVDRNRTLVLLGDACGKGVPACLLAMMTRCFARGVADKFTTLTDFLYQLNGKLINDTAEDRFITLGCCLLDRENWTMEFGRAGHTDLITYVHHHIRRLSMTGTALGILPNDIAKFETICIAFEPGTRMLMFSDGMTEATDSKGREFGVSGLSTAFQKACDSHDDSKSILANIFDAVKRYENSQSDDRSMVVISREAAE
ncbi:MAG: serine/threonine-protein phosphatase [Victivallaceae bacterium]|nr:serine/threonine-protein phosphatase [Victivallaceae bacterium]